MKTEENESRGLYDLIRLDKCWIETGYATMSEPFIFAFVAFCMAAIRGKRRNPDCSKFIRGGADNASETKGARSEVSQKGTGIESDWSKNFTVFVIDSKLLELFECNRERDSKGTKKRIRILPFAASGICVCFAMMVFCIEMSICRIVLCRVVIC